MNFYSEVLPQLLIMAAFIGAGGFAWWRKARKTAGVLWVLVVWWNVNIWLSSRITPESRQFAQKHACINNLKAIDSAAQQWAQAHEKQATNTYSFTDPTLLSLMRGSALPACPGGGHYSAGATVNHAPTCSLAAMGHTL